MFFSKEILINDIERVKDLVAIASTYSENIDLFRGRYVVDAKSIIGVFSLDLSKKVTISILTEDEVIANRFFKDLESAGI